MWRKNRKEIITIVQIRKCSYSISAGKLEGWQQRCHSFQQYRNENEPQNVLIENLFRLVSFSTILFAVHFLRHLVNEVESRLLLCSLELIVELEGEEKFRIILDKKKGQNQ